jgi:antitoxin component of MazEF toxin-antitoxin module
MDRKRADLMRRGGLALRYAATTACRLASGQGVTSQDKNRTILTAVQHCVYIAIMTKKLIKHGNSAALVIDKALLDLLKVKMETPLEVTTDGKNIIISPQNDEGAERDLLESLDRINKRHGVVLEKLGK